MADSDNGSRKKLDLPPVFNDDSPPQSQIRATRQLFRVGPDGQKIPIGEPQDITPEPITPEQFNAKAKGGAVKQKSWQRALAHHQRLRRHSTAAATARTKPKGNW
ncbi:MAG TPA: hypothetical protein VGP48_09935 [Stellaceae bacterium]|jgi:hypothetical protein|nr:hypothetical protein [Stellaceae bacterium]